MNKPLTKKEKIAWDYAKEIHKDQVRRYNNKSYFYDHIIEVNGILKKYTTDEDILIASLLHDVIEDGYEDKDVGYNVLKEKFGDKIANIVDELTSVQDEIDEFRGGKTDYLTMKMIDMSDDALTIKLADRLQNMSDIFTAPLSFREKYYLQTYDIIESLEHHRRFNHIQKTLVNNIKSKLDNIKYISIKRFNEFN